MALIDQAATGVKWNSLAVAARIIIHFGSLAILARILVPEDFGLMAMATVVTAFVQIFGDSGLSNAIVHRQNARREQLSSLYWLNLAASLALFALVWLVTPIIAVYYQELRLIPVLRWSAVGLLIMPIGQQFQSLMTRELHFRTLSWIQVLESATYGVFSVLLAFNGFGVMSLVWATLLRNTVTVGLLLRVAIRSRWLPLFRFRLTDLDGFLQFGLFQMGERSLNYLANNVDYLIIGRLLGSEALGFYALAYNVMRIPVSYFNPVLVSVAFPTFARVQNRDDLLRRGYAKLIGYLSTGTFPLIAGVFVTAPLLVPLVWGTQWLSAVPLVQIFCPLGVLKSLGNPLGSILLAKGRPDLGFVMNVISLVGYFLANMIGVRWGVVGVALSSVAFTGLVLQPIGFYLRKLTINMTVAEHWQALRKPTANVLVMMIVIVPLYYVLIPLKREFFQLLILTAVGFSVYAAMIWRFDRAFLKEAWSHLLTTDAPKL